MSKQDRVSHFCIKDKNSDVILVQWHDNSIVTVASNCHSVQPVGQVRRWSNKEKKIVYVNQPHVIGAYNKYMGGVDRLDQNVATYRISVRTKKWWWPIFSFLLSSSVNNAWVLYRLSVTGQDGKLDLLEFTRRIVHAYLQRCASQSQSAKRARSIAQDKRVLNEVRFDRVDHTIESIPKQRRCGHCGKKVSRQCAKCLIALHVDCFAAFHCK